jgi:two-component system, LuxR family, sensor kinase FixL
VSESQVAAAALSVESQALLDAAVDAVVLIGHDGIVQAFNPSAVRMFGYQPQEIIGGAVTRLMTDSDAAQHEAHLKRYLRTGEAHIIGIGRDVTARRKDGRLFPAHLSVGRLPGQGPPRFVGFLHDLSLRWEALAAIEEERERTERTRDRMVQVARWATMGEMASGIAHELNQPLAAIANFAQACTRILDSANPDLLDVKEALQQIAAQALRAGDIISHLRKLVGTPTGRRESTDINELIQELGKLTRADTRDHNVQMQWQLSADLPRLSVDRIQIQQVLLNLFRNAVDALSTLPAGSRELCIRSALDPQGDVTVSVTDNGPGVAADAVPKLFTAFSTHKIHGTGLGLAISRSIVEAHRGRLEYQPNVPRGAVFAITLPH